MKSSYRTTISKPANRNRRAVAAQSAKPLPWLLITWCCLSMLLSIGSFFWISVYQQTVAEYIREPSEDSKSKAHAYDGYPTPSFQQPLLEAADIWFKRHQTEHSEIERLREQERLQKERAANTIATLVDLVMPAIEHNVDAKRGLLSKAIEGVGEGAQGKTWEKQLATIPIATRLPPGARLEPVVFSPTTFTARTSCFTPDGSFVGKLSTVDFQVFDSKGRSWPHFTVTEEDRSFSNASVIVLVDRSLSMEGARMDQLKVGLLKVLESVTTKTQMQIVAFDHGVERLTPFTNDKSILTSAVQGLKPVGATAIADAINYAIGELQQRTGIKCILLCTDGDDKKLRAGLPAIARRCTESNIQVNVLAINHSSLDKATLTELADGTSGTLAYAAQPADIVSQLDVIVNSCKPGYRVRIFPGNRPIESFSLRLRNAPSQLARIP